MMVNVIAIKAVGNGTLVEWRSVDGLHRAVIPHGEIVSGRVRGEVLLAGIPYGVAWEDLDIPPVTAAEIAAALRQVGIWTLGDLRAKPSGAVTALQRVYAVTLAKLREAAEKYERMEGFDE